MQEQDFFNSINQINKNGISNELTNVFFNSGSKILDTAIKKARIKDTFIPTYYHPTATIHLYYKSQKTKSYFNFFYDIYTHEIVFNMGIPYWQNIKNVKDTFWSDFIEHSGKLGFVFQAGCQPFFDKKITPEFNSNFKSINFNIMCSYITSMLEPKEERENIHFGYLEKIWTSDNDIDIIIEQLNECFKIFYKFGYVLWKSEKTRVINRNNRLLKNKMKTKEQEIFQQPFYEEIKKLFSPCKVFTILNNKEDWAIDQGHIDNFDKSVYVCVLYNGVRDLNSESFTSEYCLISSPIIEILSYSPLINKLLIKIPIALFDNQDSNINTDFKNEIRKLNY